MARHTLVLVRHAKSDWTTGQPDIDRPLAKRGRRQAPEAGDWLAARLVLDLAVVSPAARARVTWDLLAAQLDSVPEVRLDERVYGANAAELLDVVRQLPEDATTVAVVGHNPGLEDLIYELTDSWTTMPTSAVAVIDLEGPWSSAGAGARLRTSGRPPV
jgi:phosphohistidine phosphatase